MIWSSRMLLATQPSRTKTKRLVPVPKSAKVSFEVSTGSYWVRQTWRFIVAEFSGISHAYASSLGVGARFELIEVVLRQVGVCPCIY
jgi:hypothetical protein